MIFKIVSTNQYVAGYKLYNPKDLVDFFILDLDISNHVSTFYYGDKIQTAKRQIFQIKTTNCQIFGLFLSTTQNI